MYSLSLTLCEQPNVRTHTFCVPGTAAAGAESFDSTPSACSARLRRCRCTRKRYSSGRQVSVLQQTSSLPTQKDRRTYSLLCHHKPSTGRRVRSRIAWDGEVLDINHASVHGDKRGPGTTSDARCPSCASPAATCARFFGMAKRTRCHYFTAAARHLRLLHSPRPGLRVLRTFG